MKKIIQDIIEILFNNIPFSKKSEEAKLKITKSLEKYTSQDSLEGIETIINQVSDIYVAGKSAGIDDTEITPLIDQTDMVSKKELQKILKKYRRYLLIESLLAVYIVTLLISLICYFSLFSIVYACLCSIIPILLILYIRNKKNKYIKESQLFNLKCDLAGKTYIKLLYDKYIKKEINMIFLCFSGLAYLLFICLISIFNSAYTLKDILQLISYNTYIICIFLFLLIKNIRFYQLYASFFVDEKNIKLWKHKKLITLFCVIYWLIAIIILILLKNLIVYVFNLFIVITIIFLIIQLTYNLTIRKNYVFNNIVVNIRRSAVVSLVVVLLASYQIMSMDTWFTQGYINTISPIQRTADDISYNDENGVYTITTDKNNFKILQLTDIHLGGSIFSITKDLKALKATEKLITASNPDLVVVTGDLVFPMAIMSFSLNNRAPVMQFASFMRNLGIPWVFTYGNHDTEAISVITDDQFDDLMKSLSYRTSNNLLYPYIQPDIYGRSNQMLEIRQQDGKLMQALFLLDSNDYIPNGQLNEYDYIHDDQVSWYAKQVTQLSNQEGYTIPSMLFFHIPLQEYKEAYELYEKESSDVQYYYGEIGETMIDKICASKYKSKLFDTALELGSTKAMFCGHDHYNNLSVEYKGIRLTYGYSIDYLAMPGIENDFGQRGATLITIDQTGNFRIEPYRLIDWDK